jgi:hypothetical protein
MYLRAKYALIGACVMTACLVASASPALAAGKPTAETKAATGVEISVATLNGVVNPEGEATKYRFEWGTASVEEHIGEWVSAGSGTTNVPVSLKLSALAVDTKYEFRVVAKDEEGKATGATLSFTTKGSTLPPEFKPGTAEKFTSAGTEFQLHYGGVVYTCKNETTDGEVTGKYTAGGVVARFTGCTVTKGEQISGCPENSVGAGAGEIVTAALKGQLGIVPTKEQQDATGLLLEPATGTTWTTLAASSKEGKVCSIEMKLQGKLALGVEPVGMATTAGEFTAALHENTNIKEIKLDSGETVKVKLTGFDGEEVSLTGSDAVTYEKATEVT